MADSLNSPALVTILVVDTNKKFSLTIHHQGQFLVYLQEMLKMNGIQIFCTILSTKFTIDRVSLLVNDAYRRNFLIFWFP